MSRLETATVFPVPVKPVMNTGLSTSINVFMTYENRQVSTVGTVRLKYEASGSYRKVGTISDHSRNRLSCILRGKRCQGINECVEGRLYAVDVCHKYK